MFFGGFVPKAVLCGQLTIYVVCGEESISVWFLTVFFCGGYNAQGFVEVKKGGETTE